MSIKESVKSFIETYAGETVLKAVKAVYFGLRKPFAYPAELLRYRYCMLTNKPYFGTVLSSTQGSVDRHPYMEKTVKLLSGRGELRILEVGSWAGGSAVVWARSLEKHNDGKGRVLCVDPWKPYFGDKQPWTSRALYQKMDAASKSGAIVHLFHHNITAAGYGDKVITMRGYSDDCLPALRSEQFDIVYIDGDHSYKAVGRDLANAKGLCREGGILCGDDLEVQYQAADKANLDANIEKDFILDPGSKTWFHPGVTKAVWECFGQEVSSYEGFWAMRRKGDKFERITLD